MVDKSVLKIYEFALLFVLVTNLLIGVVSAYYQVFVSLSFLYFVVSLSMIIIWGLMIRNKDLAKLELVIFLFAFGVIVEFGFFLLMEIGWLTEVFFGVSVFQFPFIFICFAIAFWGVTIIIKSIKQEKKKRTLSRNDLIVLVCIFILLFGLVLYYMFFV